MCGRYRLSRAKQILEEYFATDAWEEEWEPRYNIAATQPVPIIRKHASKPGRALSLARWGLIPSWAKNTSIASGTINARSETAATKPAFSDALKFRRCLIPADGFYEWQKAGRASQPYCFEVGRGELFAFAGIWDRWRDPTGKLVETCSILTTTANALTATVHDRMPVILESDGCDQWLQPKMHDLGALATLLKPYPAHRMRCHAVSSRLNRVANDDEQCARPIEVDQVQGNLFD